MKLTLNQEVHSVKILSYASYVLLFTTNTFLPFHRDMDTNLASAVGSNSKCKFRPYHFTQKIVALNWTGFFVFFPCMQNKVRNAADNFFPLQLQSLLPVKDLLVG